MDQTGALGRLLEEQAALRRVATLVAEEAAPPDVFAKVAEETASVIGEVDCALARYEGDGTITTLASCGAGMLGTIAVGERFAVDGSSVVARVLGEGLPCRVDDYSTSTGTIAERGQSYGIRSAVGCPIMVRSRIWGVIAVARYDSDPIVLGAEQRIAQFAELVATAIANADARAEVQRLAAEQAALRRVATLVARGVRPADVFSAVSREIGEMFGSAFAAVGRFDPTGPALVSVGMATEVEGSSVGTRFELEPTMASATVYRTGRSARHDDVDWADVDSPIGEVARRIGTRSTLATPIVVDGSLWGAMVITSPEPLPPDAENRLEKFTELVATAIANAESREAVTRLLDEQAALGRVATLVARGLDPTEIFKAVTDEVGRLLGSQMVSVARFAPDNAALLFEGVSSTMQDVIPVGTRWELDERLASAAVRRTGRSARVDIGGEDVSGKAGEALRRLGVISTVASPIVVQDHLWGVVTVSNRDDPLPADAEQRLAKFTELVATAVANAESQSQLAASRRRIVTAADEARRRIERDLHDGVQQQLVSLALTVGGMRVDPPDWNALSAQLATVSDDVNATLNALVHIARGIHPSILTHGGLEPALEGLARRASAPVELHAHIDRPLPAEVEVAAYYIVSEALTNVAKYAYASRVRIEAGTDDRGLTLVVMDDGVGGAELGNGSGLVGLQDRVEALGGTISVDSPKGHGTRVTVALPVAAESHQGIEMPRTPSHTGWSRPLG